MLRGLAVALVNLSELTNFELLVNALDTDNNIIKFGLTWLTPVLVVEGTLDYRTSTIRAKSRPCNE